MFRLLERAIVSRHHVSFAYQKGDESKEYEGVAPFKLMNHKGIWYLAARDGDKLKTFSFTRLAQVRQLASTFDADPHIDRRLSEEDGIWLGEERVEIVLKISSEVAGYFKRRKLIANQVI
ncbi:MAG: WYL domain-containing protein, partial [bacterium]